MTSPDAVGLARLIDAGRYREAAELCKEVAQQVDETRAEAMTQQERQWFFFLRNHDITQIEAYFADPTKRKEPYGQDQGQA